MKHGLLKGGTEDDRSLYSFGHPLQRSNDTMMYGTAQCTGGLERYKHNRYLHRVGQHTMVCLFSRSETEENKHT